MSMRVGLVVVSDRGSVDSSYDRSTSLLSSKLSELLPQAVIASTTIVPDDTERIVATLKRLCDDVDEKVDLVLTTGGTGLAERDVTPEATLKVGDREVPGLMTLIMTKSLSITPMAALSRARCVVRARTLILNLPGSPKGAVECLSFVHSVLAHAVDLVKGNRKKVDNVHHHMDNRPNECKVTQVDMNKYVIERDRSSPFPMISVKEALKRVLEAANDLVLANNDNMEKVDLDKAVNRVLADDVKAPEPLPPFRASIKDGYAVLASEGSGPRAVLGSVSAGSGVSSVQLMPNTCMRINTGAPLPSNSDAVVQVEDTKLISSDNNEEQMIEILTNNVRMGQDVREIGSDVKLNELVLNKYAELGPIEIGLCASLGLTKLPVFRMPIIGLLSTGDELVAHDTPKLRPGAIRDSNKVVLQALLAEMTPTVSVINLGSSVDEAQSLRDKLEEGFSKCDVILSTGGVSMGDRDLMRPVLEYDFHAQIIFARVNMKPGKPTTLAKVEFNKKQKLLLGLPGNPVSAATTFQLYVVPLCRKLSGLKDVHQTLIKAKIGEDRRLDARPEYCRVVLQSDENKDVIALITGNQISSRLMSCKANALLLLPPKTEEKKEVKKGETFDCIIIKKPFHTF